MSVNLDQANAIVAAALQAGRSNGMKPLTVVVLDPGGHLVAMQRQDKSGILRPDIALGKAWGALGMGLGSRDLAKRAATAPTFYAALAAMSDGRVVPVPGGVLIENKDGTTIGAVGISGDTSDNDEACAVAGITSAGLVPNTG